MSISSTRKVSGASLTTRKNERLSASNGKGESFVEHIDTANNVLVNKDFDKEKNSQQEYQSPRKERKDSDVSAGQSSTYVANAIEALEASGVYETAPQNSISGDVAKIGIYDSNQSMITEEANERKSQTYLKHFYEKNEPIEEVNKLV